MLLAALLPGPPVQAAPSASPMRLQGVPAAGPTLSKGCPGASQTCDMEDDDRDGWAEPDLATRQVPLPQAIDITAVENCSPYQGTWSLESIGTPHCRPERGCTLRRRILKKTR